MNISGISSLTNTQSTQNSFSSRAANFKALETALQNGDLPGAQSAFAAIQAGRSSSASATQPPANSDPIQKDFAALQTTLQNGDLAGAQQAFASLKQDFKSVAQSGGAGQSGDAGGVEGHHHHHHPDGGAAVPAQPAAITPSTPPASPGSILDVTA